MFEEIEQQEEDQQNEGKQDYPEQYQENLLELLYSSASSLSPGASGTCSRSRSTSWTDSGSRSRNMSMSIVTGCVFDTVCFVEEDDM